MSLRKTKLYSFVLDFVRAKKIKVRHAKLRMDINGLYDSETKIIKIDRNIKGTVLGCAVLFHELRHWHQDKHRLFPKFMAGYGKYTKKRLEDVVRAEQDAGKFAERMTRGLGLKYSAPELDKEMLVELREDWKNWYFD